VRSDRHPVTGRNKTMVEVNYFLGGTIYKNVLLFIMNILNDPFEVDRYDGFEMLNPNWVPDPVPNPPLLLQQQEQPQNKHLNRTTINHNIKQHNKS
jgi:hypothetical protein